MHITRPFLVRAWVLMVYSVPTSFLLLFAACYAFDPRTASRAGSASQSPTVSLGNYELIGAVVLLGLLVLLSAGSAVQHWLDARKPEVYARFLAGSSPIGTAGHLLLTVYCITVLSFALSITVFLALGVALPMEFKLPGLSYLGVVVAHATTAVLMLATAAAGVVPVLRRRDHVRTY